MYLTSGHGEHACDGTFIWCGINGSKQNFTGNVPWLVGEPSQEGEYNIALHISEYTHGIAGWQYHNALFYICEVSFLF
jgi:hypothetical protein